MTAEEHLLDGSGNRCTNCEAQGKEFILKWGQYRPLSGRRS